MGPGRCPASAYLECCQLGGGPLAILVGELVVDLPPCPGRPEAGRMAQQLGLESGEVLLGAGRVGLSGPAQGAGNRPAVQVQSDRVSLGQFGLAQVSLHIAIHGGGLTLPSSKIKVLVTVPVGDPLAAEMLVEIWVKLLGVPPPLHHADRLLLITRKVGCSISVDMESPEHPDAPVRMSFGCRNVDLLPEFITLFVNMQGYRVKVIRDSKR
ncbi:hypothetical protein QYE76_008001 [Lolium multiflorum]|uniref:Uncharacterized protein n=1 Tax=Lolium multiflorum TaxID=4521 RepID=A0AAD8QFT4_LOLMU|nr:hypothetical protein QYE76_008001 [Lolium multiflorum]